MLALMLSQDFSHGILTYLQTKDIVNLALTNKQIFNLAPKLQRITLPKLRSNAQNKQVFARIYTTRPAGDFLRIKSMRVTWEWKDQGWGNHKGTIYIALKRNEDVIHEKRFCVAPASYEEFSQTFNHKHSLLQDFRAGDTFEILQSAGGGGGHSLFVKEGMEVVFEYGPYILNLQGDLKLPDRSFQRSFNYLNSIDRSHSFDANSRYFFTIAEAKERGDAVTPYEGTTGCIYHSIASVKEGVVAGKLVNFCRFYYGRHGAELFHDDVDMGRVLCLPQGSFHYQQMDRNQTPPMGTIRVKSNREDGQDNFDMFVYSEYMGNENKILGRACFENGQWIFVKVPFCNKEVDILSEEKTFFLLIHKDDSKPYFDVE